MSSISLYHTDEGCSPEILAMLDGCFGQKRRRGEGGQYDAPRSHPESYWLTEEDLKAAEEFVDSLRPKEGAKASSADRSEAGGVEEDDKVESGMKIPNSVLQSCHDSFKAADDQRIKASTQYFADTGIMALVCRHDRVLWLANMTSAGEKQYYAIALLHELLKHLPPSTHVGVLYDIACQLERSCIKYGFLGNELKRFVFACSVFHAYSHEWACQLVYHPRKRMKFGLTDGEGCERLWASLQSLIGVLRVSGVSTRL